MKDHSHNLPAASAIPLAEIARACRDFPAAALEYDIMVEADQPLTGLADLAAALAECGLGLGSLRCAANGNILCRLRQTPQTDLARLDRFFAAQGGLRLSSWTTVIGC